MGCVYGVKHQQVELYFVKIAKKRQRKKSEKQRICIKSTYLP